MQGVRQWGEGCQVTLGVGGECETGKEIARGR